MPGQEGVLQLGEHRVLVAVHAVEELLPRGDAGDGVAADLVLHRHRDPTRCPELSEGRGLRVRCRRHDGHPTDIAASARTRHGARPGRLASPAGVPIDLSGAWLAAPADDTLRRRFADAAFEADAWEPVTVPHHWRREAAFADQDGPLLYRRAFEGPDPAEATADGARWWLHLDGIFYQGDIWLDGAYLGDTEGYFVPHAFEVTDQLRDRTEHLLAAEVTCAPQRTRRAKRNLTGVFQHWDCIAPDWNPGGIWRPVTLRRTGRVRIDRLRTLCVSADARAAVVQFRGVFDAATAGPVTVRTRLAGVEHRTQHQFVAGVNRTEWTVTVRNPTLWWPHALGTPHLVDLAVDVLDGLRDDEPSDGRAIRTGLREVRAKDWIFRINGERKHLKGANQGPTRMAVAECTADELRTDLELARDAGLDLLRLHAHIAHPELYRLADETGMLLWQDLPLQWATPAASARPRCSRRRRRSTSSATTPRSCTGAPTTNRWRSTSTWARSAACRRRRRR